VRSVIQEYKQSDLQWFLSQKMSMAPSLEGLIFNRFKRETFEKTPREIYQIYAGSDPGKDLTKDELISYMLSKGCKAYAGLDHGHTDPAVIISFLEDSVGNIYMLHVFAQTGLDPEQLRDCVHKEQDIYRFMDLYPDTSQPAINELIKKAKRVRVQDDFDKKGQIENGITLIRQKISPTVGGTKLFGLKGECDFFIAEMEKYHYTEDAGGRITDSPEDKFNHSIDACRYAAINRWSTGQKILGANQHVVGEETKQEYVSKVTTQQQEWLSTQIKEASEGAVVKTQKSKNRGIIWDI
jgi:hypothetical protein